MTPQRQTGGTASVTNSDRKGWSDFQDQGRVAAARGHEHQEQRGHALPRRVYFLSAAFFSAGALDADFAIDVVGTMMWAYGVPFHITHGPPLVQSVGYASS